MTALYLDARDPLQVVLEGPSLLVRGTGQAAARYPLRRVSRVVVSGAVDLETRALLACLQRGLPVVFLDAEGEPLGYCFGRRVRELPLDERLRELVALPDWQPVYENWRAAAERRELLAVVRRFGVRSADLRPASVRAALAAQRASLGAAALVAASERQLRGALSGLAAEVLAATVSADLAFARAAGLHLLEDLVAIAEWPLERTLRAVLRHRKASNPRIRVSLFERDAPALRDVLVRALWMLDLALREHLP